MKTKFENPKSSRAQTKVEVSKKNMKTKVENPQSSQTLTKVEVLENHANKSLLKQGKQKNLCK